MILYLVRHGQSSVPSSTGGHTLTPRGRQEVLQTARLLKKRGAAPQALWHSPKERARETAQILAPILGVPADRLVEKKSLGPEEGPDALLGEILSETGGKWMLVSHLPTLQGLVGRLLGTDASPLSFPSAGAAALKRREDGSWRVLWSLSPHPSRRDHAT